jgi:hypothetical protein
MIKMHVRVILTHGRKLLALPMVARMNMHFLLKKATAFSHVLSGLWVPFILWPRDRDRIKRCYLGVRGDVLDDVRVTDYLEIEAPAAVNTCLPLVRRFVVLLCVQGRVVQVLDQKAGLLIKRLADRGRKTLERVEGGFGVFELHRAGLAFLFAVRVFFMLASMEAAISSALLNGPYTRPALMSSSALFKKFVVHWRGQMRLKMSLGSSS